MLLAKLHFNCCIIGPFPYPVDAPRVSSSIPRGASDPRFGTGCATKTCRAQKAGRIRKP